MKEEEVIKYAEWLLDNRGQSCPDRQLAAAYVGTLEKYREHLARLEYVAWVKGEIE